MARSNLRQKVKESLWGEAKVVVMLDRRIHQAIIADARRSGRTAPEEMRMRLEAGYTGPLPENPGDVVRVLTPIKPKRANGTAADCTEKIFVPCPLKVKVVFMRLAREMQVTQAELGLIVVEHAVRNVEWFEEAVREYLASGRPWRGVPTSMHPRVEKRNP